RRYHYRDLSVFFLCVLFVRLAFFLHATKDRPVFPPPHTSTPPPATRRSFPRHQRGQGDCAECREGHDRIGGVRILPLPAQLFPIVRDHRPIVGRLIGRVDPDEEDDEREGNAKKREQREDE